MEQVEMLTINAEQAVMELVLIREADDKNGDPYWLYAFRGKTVLLREKAHAALEAGDVRKMQLLPTVRDVEDSEGVTVSVSGWAYAGHITNKQALAIKKTDAEFVKIDRELLATAPAVEDVTELA